MRNNDDDAVGGEEFLQHEEEEEEEEEDDEEEEEELTHQTVVDTEIESEWADNCNSQKFSIKFENFEELPYAINHEVASSEFSCFGHQWRVMIYPGGQADSEGMIGVYLQRVSGGEKL